MPFRYNDIQPLAEGCTQILVWHTMTAAPTQVALKPTESQHLVNLKDLLANMNKVGMIKLDDQKGASPPMCLGPAMCAN